MKRQINSALKSRQSPQSITRLKSAVQFKFQSETPQCRTSIAQMERLQTGTTMHTQYKTNFSTREDEVIKTQVSESNLSKVTNLRIRVDPKSETDVKMQNYFYNNQPIKVQSNMNIISKSSQKLVVTSDNLQTTEVKRKMKYDPAIRQQVFILKIKAIKNPLLQKFLRFLLSKEKQFIDLIKYKQNQQTIDLVQDFIEMAIGTQISLVVVEVLLFCSQALENCGLIELSIHLYNQTRLLCNHSKQQYDIQKMKAFIGLSNCAVTYESYEIAIKFLKKCIQYAWLNNNLEFENLVYQKMGICYFYMGNIEKASFYHERSITYDFEIEDSPLRKLSCDTLKIYLNKHFSRNYAETVNNALLSKMNFQIPIDIKQCQENLMNLTDLSQSPRLHLSTEGSRKMSISSENSELSCLKINGMRLLKDILSQQEFDFQVYTPKHSFRTESKCFEYLNNKKIHPKDIYHDAKYKTNPFVIDDLGIIKSKKTSQAENMSKYKLPLDQQIEIRLQQKFQINLQEKIQHYVGSSHQKAEQKNKILLTHKNQENSKRNKQMDEIKKFNAIAFLYQNLISKLIG
ncbi:unnamed protein product [Paramecium primaurelia]|uniref:Uncharacterized protein n=1 Tax=Paramecium primaurelia TaxID=5886 RepID=A0A8S1KTY8_PARPR|nr:unnamed protein product [Paramecium primaurelia]